MTYRFRMTLPDNCTTLADDIVELVNPTKDELVNVLNLLLSKGKVSCLITGNDGIARFYAHDLVLLLVSRLMEV